MNEQICEAISEMRILTFTYDDPPRVVEPHARGLSKADKEIVRAYQIDGGTNSEDGELGWRPFLVGKMQHIQVLEDVFTETRPQYVRGDRGMSLCPLRALILEHHRRAQDSRPTGLSSLH